MTIAELEQIAVNVPLVVAGHLSRSPAFDTVAADDQLGAKLVVEHLVALGHKRIAFVMNGDGQRDETGPEYHRLRCFERAMSSHGLDSDAIVLESRLRLDSGFDAVGQSYDMNRPPTAVHGGADIVTHTSPDFS